MSGEQQMSPPNVPQQVLFSQQSPSQNGWNCPVSTWQHCSSGL